MLNLLKLNTDNVKLSQTIIKQIVEQLESPARDIFEINYRGNIYLLKISNTLTIHIFLKLDDYEWGEEYCEVTLGYNDTPVFTRILSTQTNNLTARQRKMVLNTVLKIAKAVKYISDNFTYTYEEVATDKPHVFSAKDSTHKFQVIWSLERQLIKTFTDSEIEVFRHNFDINDEGKRLLTLINTQTIINPEGIGMLRSLITTMVKDNPLDKTEYVLQLEGTFDLELPLVIPNAVGVLTPIHKLLKPGRYMFRNTIPMVGKWFTVTKDSVILKVTVEKPVCKLLYTPTVSPYL
jgi:hypothetical protein